jgi:predicted glutamine amidotransferase
VWRIIALVAELGGGAPSYLNLAVTDGDRAAACRFANDPGRNPESLYLIQRELYQPVWKGSPGRRRDERSTSFVVSSERLTDDGSWHTVEPNHMISLCRDGTAHVFSMKPEGLVAT